VRSLTSQARRPIFKFNVVASQTIAGVFSSTSSITVDWGDGTTNTYNGNDKVYSKNYGSVGTRTVRVYGASEAVLTKYTIFNGTKEECLGEISRLGLTFEQEG